MIFYCDCGSGTDSHTDIQTNPHDPVIGMGFMGPGNIAPGKQ